MRITIALAALMLGSCTTHGGRSCAKLTDQLCDICPKDEWDRARCRCFSEGTLTAADMPPDVEVTNDEAARICSNLRYNTMYPGPDTAASCKADLEYIKEWNVDACEDLGWSGR